MRRSLAFAGIGLAVAASFAPVQSASAVCWPDLSSVGGPSCPNVCQPVAGLVNRITGQPTLMCLA